MQFIRIDTINEKRDYINTKLIVKPNSKSWNKLKILL